MSFISQSSSLPAGVKTPSFAVSNRVKDEVSKSDVWSVFSPASGHVPKDSLNLGQGYMNWAPPDFVQKAAEEAVNSIEANHYSVTKGRIRLRNALSKWFSESYNLGREINVDTEVIVTAGANEGMYAFEAAFLQDGDEVIMFEPFFDQYLCNTTFNGGVPVFVAMTPPTVNPDTHISSSADWKVDISKLRAAITPKTKIIIVNTPHNPIGKVFDEDELREIGKIAEEFDLLICADEVYDCMTYGVPHIRIAGLDDFWHRTITIGSVGKSFCATGWRIGWCIGPEHIIKPTLAATTRIIYAVNSPLQEAAAAGFELAPTNKFFDVQIAEYEERFAVFRKYLDDLGLPYSVPQGAYFILLNNSRIKIPDDFVVPKMLEGRPKDWIVSWFMAQTVGVVAIPASDFYCADHKTIGADYTRFAFCKDLDTLRRAGERLQGLKPYIMDA